MNISTFIWNFYFNKQRFLICLLIAFNPVILIAQESSMVTTAGSTIFSPSENKNIVLPEFNKDSIRYSYDNATLGFGLGLDFGGLVGMKVTYYPIKNIGIFGGLGYALIDPGYNIGLKFRILSSKRKKQLSPYLIAMYGYNAIIKVSNASQFDKIFYGATTGLGMDFQTSRNKSYWSLAVLIPFRSPDVQNYIDDLKKNHGVVFKNDLFPLAFSVGYNFILSRN